jgi:hypothetical protein
VDYDKLVEVDDGKTFYMLPLNEFYKMNLELAELNVKMP